ncbi:MAG: hypothetical protein WCG66_09205 [bacterium]
MPLCSILLVLLAFVSPPGAFASDSQEIAFAVPGTGLISLGVFNKSGKLVRTLHALDGQEAFRIGLNGYITQWDGRDDSGQKVPSGRYFLRGYLVGDVSVEGEAFHFNDWVSSEESITPRRVLDLAMLDGGDVLVGGETAAGQVFCGRYSSEKGFVWCHELPASSSGLLLAANNLCGVIYCSDGWKVFSLRDGEDLPVRGLPGGFKPNALAAADESIYLAGMGGIQCIAPGAETTRREAPVSFSALAASAYTLAGISSGSVWASNAAGHFEKVSIPASVESISAGEGRTLWLSGRSMDPDATPVVAQVNLEGVILRALVPDPHDPQPVLVRASRTSDVFAVLEESAGLQRLRVLSRNPEGGWTIEWERSILDAPEFGFVEGIVQPRAPSKQPTSPLRIRLEETPLAIGHQEIAIQAVSGPQGVSLATPDGLLLLEVSHRPDVARVVMERGAQPDSLRILQGNGAVVEEYLVQNLRRIAPLVVGQFEIP